MGTTQLTHEPDGGNGHGGNGKAPFGCPHGKKPFDSREEAEQFEAENSKRFPNRSRQYAYKCSDCPAHHLSSKPPEAYAMGQSNLKRLEGFATDDVVKNSARRKRRGETEAEVRQLWEQGLNDTAIASQLGIVPASVAYHRKKFAGTNSGTDRISARQLKMPLTPSDLDEQQRKVEQEYQAKREWLEQQRQRFAEANKLTVCECQEGAALFIKFGHHERMMVPKEKVRELTDALMNWV